MPMHIIERSSPFNCLFNFGQLSRYQRIFIGNKPDARDCDTLELGVVLHNWPSQWHSRYPHGYIQIRINGRCANFDIADNSINRKTIYIFTDRFEIQELATKNESKKQDMAERVKDLNKEGERLQMEGNWYGAIRKYKEAIRLNPLSPSAHSLLGFALFGLGENEEAIYILNRGIALTSERWLLARMYDARGLAKSNSGDIDGARGDFKGALKHSSNSPRILTHAGILEERAGQFEVAYTYALRALRYNATYPPALRLRERLEKNGHVKPLRVNLGRQAA